jgi:hypothetical protein
MSISSLTDGAIQRKLVAAGASTQVTPTPPAGTVVGAPASGAVTPRTITPLKGATDLGRYIPTEAIALYVAILAGAFAPLKVPTGKTLDTLDFVTRWRLYFIMLAVTAGLVWLIYAAKQRQTPVKDPGKWFNIPVFEMAIAVAAMAAWAAALPDSPFEDFHWYGGWFAPIVLSTSIALLPLIAAAAGKTAPSYEQTE